MKITCIDKEIKAVLESGYYSIPRFQRPYLWDRENVEEFWTDSIVDSEGEHFIGSIVVYSPKNGIYYLVDGQQRLTTITMTLCAIRNALESNGFSNLAKGVHYLIERPDINNRNQYILQSETSYPYLQEYIQKFGGPDIEPKIGEEETLLKSAYDYIVQNVNDSIKGITIDPSIPQKKKKELIRTKLSEIRDRLLSLKLIFIELDNEDDAYVIFETLNTRGKDLRVSDLVKNHITRLLRPKNAKVDLSKERWNDVVELIEESSADISVDNFLHHLWLSQYEYITSKKLFKAIKRHVKKSNAQKFLDNLVRDARTYRGIHETAFRKWEKHELGIKSSIEALNLFRVKQDLPMILSVMREYEASNLKLKHVERVLGAIENFHFAFTAITSQRSSGGISLMYAYHARELNSADSLELRLATIDELIEKLRVKRPSYPEFEATFLEILYSRKFTKQKKLVQYILEKLYRHHNISGVPVDYSLMTIEHLAPENPSSSQNTLPDEVIAQIGNLILVNQDLNNKLGNKSFQQKKMILQNSSVWVDDIIKNSSTWAQAEIEQRSRALAKLAYDQVWKL